MAELPVHISQAEHNEKTAEFLLDKPFFDWAITACFYSAIHYFEARLFFDSSEIDKKHTEKGIPVDPITGDTTITPHRWRERVIHDRYSQNAWKSFRNLKEASEIARYLSHYPKRGLVSFKTVPSYEIFDRKNSKFFLEKDLATFKKELKIDLLLFLFGLKIDETKWVTNAFMFDKVLRNFLSKEELLNETAESLRRYLTKDEISLLEQYLINSGRSLHKQ